MARRWTTQEEERLRAELVELYVYQNKTIFEIAEVLGVKYQTVYDRMIRLGIKSTPLTKIGSAQCRRSDITISEKYTSNLAEFFGIMLGDGHLAYFQVMVTLGTKESDYVQYVKQMMRKLFGIEGHVATNRKGYHTVYLGSRSLVEWFKNEGLETNKVKSQVDVPKWIFRKDQYISRFLRGFFDTDGSIYKLKFGMQISFCNHSLPMLQSLHFMLKRLGYRPSAISGWQIYLTRRDDVYRFFKEIKPANTKHLERYRKFKAQVVP